MKFVRIAAGVTISLVFLVLAFRGVHVGEVKDALRSADYLWLVPAVLAIVASIALRAVRWRALFYPHDRDLRLGSVFGSMNVGYLVNDVLPLRLGEVVRAYLLDQKEGVGVARAFSTVAVERVIDLVVTIAFLAAVTPFVSLPSGFNGPAVVLLTLAAVTALGLIVLAGARREQVHRLGRMVTGRLPVGPAEKLHELLDSVLHGFAALNRPSVAARVTVLSVVLWLLAALGLWCTMFAFDIRLGPSAPLFVLALVSLSFVIPASPGYIGVFEWTVRTALSSFAVADSTATSYALITHLVTFLPPMLLGALYLWSSGISLGRLFASSSTAVPVAVEPEPTPVAERR